MTVTRISVLTPPGAGAIATVAVAGPEAWNEARTLFRPVGKALLPERPPLHRFWFGTLADGDEVVLAVRRLEPEVQVEIHCHGGRQVLRWVVEQFTKRGVVEAPAEALAGSAADLRWATEARQLLTRAPTLRTASILLDQTRGTVDLALRAIRDQLHTGNREAARKQLAELHSFASLGAHLVEPWKVVLAGPPNVGKSSLLNALAGYQRSVVSATAGTTRDIVTVPVAFEGWPVELADTAGLRRAAESLEEAGIERARQFLAKADLVLWLLDASEPHPVWPTEESSEVPRLDVLNKYDVAGPWCEHAGPLLHVSARTGTGLADLTGAITHRLVPAVPLPGAAVPFTPALRAVIENTLHALAEAGPQAALAHLDHIR